MSEDLLAAGVWCGDVASLIIDHTAALEIYIAALVRDSSSSTEDTEKALSESGYRIVLFERDLVASRAARDRHGSVASNLIGKIQNDVRAALHDRSYPSESGASVGPIPMPLFFNFDPRAFCSLIVGMWYPGTFGDPYC